jgi:hypothetical protein
MGRQTQDAYTGTCTWKGDGNWTLTVWSEVDGAPARLKPEQLFDADKLTSELREEGLAIQAVALREDRCLVAPVIDGKRLAPEARKILRVLRRGYNEIDGHGITWSWDVPQHN